MSTHIADRIAAAIRDADGNHGLGAGALGEALVPEIVKLANEAVEAALSSASIFLDDEAIGCLRADWDDLRTEEWGA